MQILFFIVAITIAFALVSANVSTQAKKVKQVGAAERNGYFSFAYYDSANCTDLPTGVYAIANNGCWYSEDCLRRSLEVTTKSKELASSYNAKLAKKYAKPAGILEKVRGMKKDKKLADVPYTYSTSLSFAPISFTGVSLTELRIAGFTDEVCANFAYSPDFDNFAFDTIDVYPSNVCLSEGPNDAVKFTLAPEPALINAPNGYIAYGLFSGPADATGCANGAYGTRGNKGADVYYFTALGVCTEGRIYSVSGQNISYTSYENNDCTGSSEANFDVVAGTCQPDGDYIGFLGGCGESRVDIVLPGTPKAGKKAAATSLRI